MKTPEVSTATSEDAVALSQELPLKQLKRDLKAPLPTVREVDRVAIEVAMKGDVPDPAAYVEEVHGERFDTDVAGPWQVAQKGLSVLQDYGARATLRLKKLNQFLRQTDTHMKVPADARKWTGFERFRTVFLIVLWLAVVGLSIQQLAQLLVVVAAVEFLIEGLRFAFVPLVVVAALEIAGHQLVTSDRGRTYYSRLLFGVSVCAGLCWVFGFTSEFGSGLGSKGNIDIEAVVSVDMDNSTQEPTEAAASNPKDRSPWVLFASVICEIFGAALIWIVSPVSSKVMGRGD